MIVVGIARLGASDQSIVAGPLNKVLAHDFGGPLHSIIIPGKMHEIEISMLKEFYCLSDAQDFMQCCMRHHN